MKKKFLAIFLISLTFFDRLSKKIFLDNPNFHQSKFIQLQLKKNSGLYFFNLDQKILIPFSFFTILFLTILLFKSWKKKNWFLALSSLLILLGGLSNLYDRLIFGYVIDWFWIFLFPISVINLADIMITAGVFLIAIDYLLKI